MAKWWDERANYMRKLQRGEVPAYTAPPPAQPAPATTGRVSNLLGTWGTWDAWDTQYPGWGSGTRSTSTDSFYDAFLNVVQRIQSPLANKPVMPVLPVQPVEEKDPTETVWDGPTGMYTRLVIARRNPVGDGVEYMHMTGRINREDTMRVLSRYWSTRERVNRLFTSGIIDILHPKEAECRWTRGHTVRMTSTDWERGTLSQSIFIWRDGLWAKRDSDNLWVFIDPANP